MTAEPYNPGIRGGCRTVETNGAHDVTFTNAGRLLLTITPKGKLEWGDVVTAKTDSHLIADMILNYFGRAYGSHLGKAEERASHAEHRALRLERENADLKARILKLEAMINPPAKFKAKDDHADKEPVPETQR